LRVFFIGGSFLYAARSFDRDEGDRHFNFYKIRDIPRRDPCPGRCIVKRAALKTEVDWTDPVDVRLWIAALRVQLQDLTAAGDDATRPPRRRILSRAESKRRILLAERAAEALLDVAEKSLPGGLA
jgi:hypothetical protein